MQPKARAITKIKSKSKTKTKSKSKSKSKSKTKSMHTKKSRNTRRNAMARGNNDDKVNCCMCNKEIMKSEGLIPAACLIKNGRIRAHRICSDCWWNTEYGFAREGVNHACPGCKKAAPLAPDNAAKIGVIDLTSDD